MKSSYEYIEKHKLVLVKWSGIADLEQYKKYIDSFTEGIGTIDVQKVIQDITDLDFEIDQFDLKQLVDIRKENIKQDFKVVYITSKPHHVVFSELYSDALPDKKSHMYCSSTKKALELLNVSMSVQELDDRLYGLLKKTQGPPSLR